MGARVSWRRIVGAAFAVGLVATACRGGSGGGSGESAGGTEGGGTSAAVRTDAGVTAEPCPGATDARRGCIYLGTVSDLTEGAFAPLGKAFTEAQKAFWGKVNADGGIGGYDVDVTTYVRDNKYNPQIHNQVFQEIKGKVLALAQTLGSTNTAAIMAQLEGESIVASPASWTSAWAFRDVIAEAGTNYCFEAMNAVDFAVADRGAKSVMALHYDGDYGDDAAAGARVAAQAHRLPFTDVETTPGQANQAEAIERLVSTGPDVVVITTNGTDMSVILGQAAARGFKGLIIGTYPTWNPGLLKGAAGAAIKARYLQSAPWEPFGADTPGHQAMRQALGPVTPVDAHQGGWAMSYPLKAALERAVERKDLTRAGLLAALRSLESVDFQGMLPAGAGNFAGGPAAVPRQTVLNRPDEGAPTGVSVLETFFEGPTAKSYAFQAPCFEAVR